MPRLFLECAVRAALIVAAASLVLYVMRVKAAAVKHRVWTAVLLLMLLLPAWTAWGPKAPLRILPQLTETVANEFEAQAFSRSSQQPIATSVAATRPERPSAPIWQFISLVIYLLGVLSLLARLAIGTLKAHALVRRSILRDGRLTNSLCAAPVTVGWLHPKVILPKNWRTWTQTQLEAVLTHENEHARRRDPAIQWLALLNRAIFWPHPAAWWLERHLATLAEETCDAAVLASGHNPRAYAQTLIEMARSIKNSGARLKVVGMAMPGSSLPQRIKRIVEGTPAPRISRPHMACLAAACAVTCTAFAAGTLERTRQGAAAGDKPKFDAASIKPSQSPNQYLRRKPGGLYTANITLRDLIASAYLKGFPPPTRFVFGGPAWIDSERFEIEAKADGNPEFAQENLMVQSLLEDRFKLVLHHEVRQLPVYALLLSKPGKTGPQLTQHSALAKCADASAGQAPPKPAPGEALGAFCGGFFMSAKPGDLRETGNGVAMDLLGSQLLQFLDRPTVDRTGLTGLFDFTLEFAPETGPGSLPTPDANASDPSTQPTIFVALQQQLGLKLESQKGPVDVIVIDHIEEPSPN